MWRAPPVIRQALQAGLGVVFHKRKIHQISFDNIQGDVDELYGVLVGKLEIKTQGEWRAAPPHAFAFFQRRSIFGIRPEQGYTGPVEVINILFRSPPGWQAGLKKFHLQLPDVWWRRYLDLEADCRYDAAGQRVVTTASILAFVEAVAGSRVALQAETATVVRGAGQGIRSAGALVKATSGNELLSPRRPDVQVEWMETWAAAEEVIRRRAGEGLSAAELARAVDVSPTQLRRIFHAVRGISPKAALTEFRIEQAKKLLASGDVSITQVAERVGYETIQRFSAAFRAATGQTPTTFARSG